MSVGEQIDSTLFTISCTLVEFANQILIAARQWLFVFEQDNHIVFGTIASISVMMKCFEFLSCLGRMALFAIRVACEYNFCPLVTLFCGSTAVCLREFALCINEVKAGWCPATIIV